MTTLVLLPGLHGTADLFRPLMAAFSKDIAVSVAEFPVDAVDYAHVDSTVSLPDGRVALLAESFSGPLAVRLALRLKAEGRLSALIFVATFVRSPMPWFPWWLVPTWAPVPPLSVVTRVLLGAGADPVCVSELAAVLKRIPPATALGRLRAVARCDERAHLAQLVGVPTLYLQAGDDRVVGPRSLADFARLRPQVVVLPAPHLVLQTHPAACAHAISQFLNAHR